MKKINAKYNWFRLVNMLPLRPILPFTNTDVSRHILVLDTAVFANGNMGQREY
jgi:hypothetical protein